VNRSTRLFLRLTPQEKQDLANRAKACTGYTLAQFVREILTTGKVQPVLPINLDQWSRLGGMMSNLNQLAKHANEGTKVSTELLPLLEQIAAEVTSIRHDIKTRQEARS